jgi:hypothetical protein
MSNITANTFQNRKSDGCTGEFYQTFQEEMTSIPYDLFQNIEAMRTYHNSFSKPALLP